MIIKNAFIYLSSSILSRSIPFLLLPVMTHYLTPEEYGVLSIFMLMITLHSAVIGMNMHANISRNFFKIPRDELAGYIGNILFILLLTTLFFFLVAFGLWKSAEKIFSLETSVLLIVPLISGMSMINILNTTLLRNEQRAYMFGVFEVSNTIVKIGVTVLLLVVFGFGWYSQVVGITASATLFSVVGLVYMAKRHYLNFRLDRAKIKSILHISLPLIPHTLGGVVISLSDRLFIEKMLSLKEVGLYSVGYSIGMIVMLFTDAFIKAWNPWLYKNLAEATENKKIKIVKYTYIFIISIFVLALGVSFMGRFILPYFVDEKFYAASQFILWIAIGYAIRGVYQIFFPYLVYMGRTSFLAVSTVTAALVNLLLNYFLISAYGAIGAAYATAWSFAISAVLVFWYQKKRFEMPWNMKRKKHVFES